MIRVDYSQYSLTELEEAIKSIDKQKYVGNYQALMNEYSKRENNLAAYNEQTESQLESSEPNIKTTSEFERLLGICFFGLIFGAPIGAGVDPNTLTGSDIFISLLLITMFGGLLVHSFNNGWTFGGNNKFYIKEDPIMFTVVQLIYAWLLGLFSAVFVLAVFS
ncbi:MULTISPECIES: hypothetical protein [Pseudoalteromonas]|uniref:hypothetical protein n=1 Tax=Pseudoalteromonas TaxID=53246 RepID=UPI00211884A1|nr:hypothetical protein [Pseudoalteromonas carrageenovora]MCQ8888574.1 hypothetical protein [Pseudoalteromonas carrageenovora]MDO6464252.1 hypothetical protein [Pseudoalteromonas carrageenovora]MDO6635676.1 hypothetical protein [Pseudoalteromonas carrageenovora]MDO6649649.1 hypothetical protein [Pseudoalteromonas carrageenovora]